MFPLTWYIAYLWIYLLSGAIFLLQSECTHCRGSVSILHSNCEELFKCLSLEDKTFDWPFWCSDVYYLQDGWPSCVHVGKCLCFFVGQFVWISEAGSVTKVPQLHHVSSIMKLLYVATGSAFARSCYCVSTFFTSVDCLCSQQVWMHWYCSNRFSCFHDRRISEGSAQKCSIEMYAILCGEGARQLIWILDVVQECMDLSQSLNFSWRVI